MLSRCLVISSFASTLWQVFRKCADILVSCLHKFSNNTVTLICDFDQNFNYQVYEGEFMTSPIMSVIRVNLEMAKEVALEWEQASHTQLNAYCLDILREIGCSDTELPVNLQTREQQLNFIAGFASYAFGEVQNVQSVN